MLESYITPVSARRVLLDWWDLSINGSDLEVHGSSSSAASPPLQLMAAGSSEKLTPCRHADINLWSVRPEFPAWISSLPASFCFCSWDTLADSNHLFEQLASPICIYSIFLFSSYHLYSVQYISYNALFDAITLVFPLFPHGSHTFFFPLQGICVFFEILGSLSFGSRQREKICCTHIVVVTHVLHDSPPSCIIRLALVILFVVRNSFLRFIKLVIWSASQWQA